jgi:hypothetical protein
LPRRRDAVAAEEEQTAAVQRKRVNIARVQRQNTRERIIMAAANYSRR